MAIKHAHMNNDTGSRTDGMVLNSVTKEEKN